jgi:cephalosporin hydroxylase
MITLNLYRKYDLVTESENYPNEVQGRFDVFGIDEYKSWFDMVSDQEILDVVIDHQKQYGKINLYDDNPPNLERN